MDDDEARQRAATYPVSPGTAEEVAEQIRRHARSARQLAEGWDAHPALAVMFGQRARAWSMVAEAVEREGSLDALLAHAPEDAA